MGRVPDMLTGSSSAARLHAAFDWNGKHSAAGSAHNAKNFRVDEFTNEFCPAGRQQVKPIETYSRNVTATR
jgi:hypothetical protein